MHTDGIVQIHIAVFHGNIDKDKVYTLGQKEPPNQLSVYTVLIYSLKITYKS